MRDFFKKANKIANQISKSEANKVVMQASMENDVIAIILGIIGFALFLLLQGSLFGWLILGFFGCCSFVLMWQGGRNEENVVYEQKVEKLEKRVEELESKENANNFNYCDNCGKALSLSLIHI